MRERKQVQTCSSKRRNTPFRKANLLSVAPIAKDKKGGASERTEGREM